MVQVQTGRQIPQRLTITAERDGESTEVVIHYLLYLPKSYAQPASSWPLILFLHGFGESGDGELELVKKHGPPKIVEQDDDFPFVVISPQCPPLPLEKLTEAWRPEQLIQLIDHVVNQLRIDENRVYVTGLSMGGFGTWRLAATHPDRLAAAVPICGGGEQAWAGQLKAVPIWCFHGAHDSVVPVDLSQRMVAAVRQAGGDVELTVYPDAEHDSWTETYENREVYDWMLRHTRGE